MSDSQNPYAAPSADTDFARPHAGSEDGVYRDGQFLVIPAHGAGLPARCVVCNAPAQARLVRKLYWHPPGYYVLIFISALVYVVVAMIVRRRAHFELSLCDQHARRRRYGILLGWLGSIVCFGALIATAASNTNSAIPYLLLVFGFVGSLVGGILLARVVSAHRIDKQHAWLRVGRPFLDSF
jgi:hypothetical protein